MEVKERWEVAGKDGEKYLHKSGCNYDTRGLIDAGDAKL